MQEVLKCERPSYRLSDSVTDGPDSRDAIASKQIPDFTRFSFYRLSSGARWKLIFIWQEEWCL